MKKKDARLKISSKMCKADLVNSYFQQMINLAPKERIFESIVALNLITSVTETKKKISL